ncbi:hypothetical protein J2794_006313 [Paraburkholderia terricola]|jgi:hypothetical protein|uniref:hypothetical protein n=1 Tax=Paraburkholderia terricola TaxID=169427 RepID=UPI00286009E0|nr:hypothetical protein [Paraburkholderia terricola]MDR6450173.1 hypothetical protein [Paraburkholderia terricola]
MSNTIGSRLFSATYQAESASGHGQAEGSAIEPAPTTRSGSSLLDKLTPGLLMAKSDGPPGRWSRKWIPSAGEVRVQQSKTLQGHLQDGKEVDDAIEATDEDLKEALPGVFGEYGSEAAKKNLNRTAEPARDSGERRPLFAYSSSDGKIPEKGFFPGISEEVMSHIEQQGDEVADKEAAQAQLPLSPEEQASRLNMLVHQSGQARIAEANEQRGPASAGTALRALGRKMENWAQGRYRAGTIGLA